MYDFDNAELYSLYNEQVLTLVPDVEAMVIVANLVEELTNIGFILGRDIGRYIRDVTVTRYSNVLEGEFTLPGDLIENITMFLSLIQKSPGVCVEGTVSNSRDAIIKFQIQEQ